MSDTVANRFAANAQCAAQAMLIIRIAYHIFTSPAACAKRTSSGNRA